MLFKKHRKDQFANTSKTKVRTAAESRSEFAVIYLNHLLKLYSDEPNKSIKYAKSVNEFFDEYPETLSCESILGRKIPPVYNPNPSWIADAIRKVNSELMIKPVLQQLFRDTYGYDPLEKQRAELSYAELEALWAIEDNDGSNEPQYASQI